MAKTPPVLPAVMEYSTVSPASSSVAETVPTATAALLPSAFSARSKP